MKISFLELAWILALLTGCASHRQTQAQAAKVLPAPMPLTSPGAKFAILPSAVQRSITASMGAAEIKDINKVGVEQDVYEVRFSNPLANPNLYVGEDGSLVNGDTPAWEEGWMPNLPIPPPPPVQKALQERAPNAAVAIIEPTEHTIYEITFADPGTHPKMLITEDGTVLKAQ